jgi:hypothetical protein
MSLAKTKKEQELFDKYKKYLSSDEKIPQSIITSYKADVDELVNGTKTKPIGIKQKAYLGYID